MSFNLETAVRDLGSKLAKAEDKRITKHLSKTLFLDSHFQEWFKKHYDFCILMRGRVPEVGSKPIKKGVIFTVVTEGYAFEGPTWIPLKTRIRRRIRSLCLRPYFFFLRHVPRKKFSGRIDSVRVFNRALSAKEIKRHYRRALNDWRREE